MLGLKDLAMPSSPRRRVQGLLLGAALAIAFAGHPSGAWAAGGFNDIAPQHWAARPAQVLAHHLIMPGRTSQDFAGEAVLTRYELAWILSHLFRDSSPPGVFQVLSDMPPQHATTAEVQRSLGYGLMSLRRPGYFEGDQAAKRKEVILGLDAVLTKNGVSPPAPRNSFEFSDVPKNTVLGAALDRIANRYGLLDGRSSGDDFKPEGAYTRYQVLGMLVRAMRYLSPGVAAELKSPSPEPSVNLLASPLPSHPPSPRPLPSGALPPTPGPEAAPAGWWSRVAVGPLALMNLEQLPTEAGLTVAGEATSVGTVSPGGGLALAYWTPSWGLSLEGRALYTGILVASGGKEVPVDLVEGQGLVGGHWVAYSGPDSSLTLGLLAGGRYVYNLSGQLVSQSYMTADKTYLGAGPALGYGLRLGEGLALQGRLGVVPMLQTYNLPGLSPSILRVGLHPDLGLAWRMEGGLLLEAKLSGLVAIGGGGVHTQLGLTTGLGWAF